MGNKKTKKSKRSFQKRYYGVVKVKDGAKFAWLSAENKFGWSLGFALNNRTVWLRNVRFSSSKEVTRALRASVVFIKLKKSK